MIAVRHQHACSKSCVATRNGSRGMTLVELMVALTISLVILAVMIQIFVSSRVSYTQEEGMARIQENGRFAIETLTTDIRMAGHFGCINLPAAAAGATPDLSNKVYNAVQIPAGAAAMAYDPNGRAGIIGFRHTGSGTNPATSWSPPLSTSGYFDALDTGLRPFSDVLVIKYATSSGVQLINNRTATGYAQSGELQIDSANANLFQVNDMVMVHKCNMASIFKITDITTVGAVTTLVHNIGPTDNVSNLLNSDYGRGDEFLNFNTLVYYVADTDRNDRTGNPIPALFRKRLTAVGGASTLVREELVEGVEAIRIYYGLSNPAAGGPRTAPDRYVPADQIPATPGWALVKSVKIAVVVTSPEETTTDQENTGNINLFGLGSDALDDYDPPNDRRTRRVFSTVVQKRQPPRLNEW